MSKKKDNYRGYVCEVCGKTFIEEEGICFCGGTIKENVKCECGFNKSEHKEADLREWGEGFLLICPKNISGLAPSVFKAKSGKS